LRKTKWLFLKDKSNFTDKQYFKFESIRASNYEVSQAWLIKENFHNILKRECSQEVALSLLLYMWKNDAKSAQIKEIDEVVEIEQNGKGIINAIITAANNARAEQLNGAIQIGRGYGNATNFRIAILFFHGNLDMISHK
jgi:oligoribonuclease NrnB/cAMP/cGMP phosphodiesterase (DHH superfamily)